MKIFSISHFIIPIVLVVFFASLQFTSQAQTTTTFEGIVYSGSGTQNDPYTASISTAAQLVAFSHFLSQYIGNGLELIKWYNITLANDIDMSGCNSFIPIGVSKCPFIGVFDGAGHTISNFNISCSQVSDTVKNRYFPSNSSFVLKNYYKGFGLFGDVRSVDIKNLNLSGSIDFNYPVTDLAKTYSCAAFVGCVRGPRENVVSKITNCSNHCSVNISTEVTSTSAGGFVGTATDIIQFEKCINAAEISSIKTSASGFVGMLNATSDTKGVNFAYCYNIGQITSGSSRAMAFIAWIVSGQCYYYNCYSAATYNGTIDPNFGNFSTLQNKMRNCYSTVGTNGKVNLIDDGQLTSGELTYKLNQNNWVGLYTNNEANASPGDYWQQDLTRPVYYHENSDLPIIRCKTFLEFPLESEKNQIIFTPINNSISLPYDDYYYIDENSNTYYSGGSYTTLTEGESTLIGYYLKHFITNITINGTTMTAHVSSSGVEVNNNNELILTDSTYLVSYKWDEAFGGSAFQPIAGATNNTCAYDGTKIYSVTITLTCDDIIVTLYAYFGTNPVVFLDNVNGNDNNDGLTNLSPIKTFERAYSILPSEINGGSVESNIIIIMSDETENFLYSGNETEYNTNSSIYNKPATITSYYNYNNTVYDYIGAKVSFYSGDDKPYLGNFLFADTKFDYIELYFAQKICFIYCQGHDLTMNNNVTFSGTKSATVSYSNGCINNGLSYPDVHIICGWLNYGDNMAAHDYTIPDETIHLKIGGGISLMRIIMGSKSVLENAQIHSIQNKTMGTPQHPYKVTLTLSGENTKVNTIVCGQTDGSCFIQPTINMHAGNVGRIIGGTIGFNRDVIEEPDNTFFGNTVINMTGGQVKELFGGSLGRGKNNCYFYGTIEMNISGDAVVNSTLYGAGAGGVVGKGMNGIINSHQDYLNTEEHCVLPGTVTHIANTDGSYITDFINNLPDGEKIVINIMGGTINGNVYAGGYGLSEYLFEGPKPAIMTFDDMNKFYKTAGIDKNNPSQVFSLSLKMARDAGSVYCPCYVNISGGTINGNVYGGSRGSNLYQKVWNIVKDEFSSTSLNCDTKYNILYMDNNGLANIYNNCEVNISGGTINGNVYGGGESIAEPTVDIDGTPITYDQAVIHGNTTVNISNGALINGSVFGGGDDGRVAGNTNVKIVGETTMITHDVFGGGDHSNVGGSSHVQVGEK